MSSVKHNQLGQKANIIKKDSFHGQTTSRSSTNKSTLSSKSFSTKHPLVEPHITKPTNNFSAAIKKDVSGLPSVKKGSNKTVVSTPSERPLSVSANEQFPASPKLSLFEALELADNIEKNKHKADTDSVASEAAVSQIEHSSSNVPELGHAAQTVRDASINYDHESVVPARSQTDSKSTPREIKNSDSLKRKVLTKSTFKEEKSGLKPAEINYHRYLRAHYLNLSLQKAYEKRQESAFMQLYSLTAENCRIENEIADFKSCADHNYVKGVLNKCIGVLNDSLLHVVTLLKQFLPLFVNFALSVDATRHRFYLKDVKIPLGDDLRVPLDYCNELSQSLAMQVGIIQEILNSNQSMGSEKLELFCVTAEKFVTKSDKIEKSLKKCQKRCDMFFRLMNQSATKTVPSILSNVNAADNLDLSVFKF